MGAGVALIIADSRQEASQTAHLETLIAGGGSPEAAPLSASLWINADPIGSTVFVDGDSVGVTPVWVESVAPGDRWVQVRGGGLLLADTVLVAASGQMAELDLTAAPASAEPATGTVEVAEAPPPAPPPREPAPRPEPTIRQIQVGDLRITSSPTGATVVLGGRVIGTTPLAIDGIEAGRHAIRLSMDGYEPEARNVTVRAGALSEANVSLRSAAPARPAAPEIAQVGTVEVLVRPWGTVFINEEVHQRETDVVYRTQLPVGTHNIRVTHPTLGTSSRTIRVGAGSTARIEFDLDDEAPGGGDAP
ncbi:MAG: PEGA domain-containing protein [Bacteroidota bacterium]